LQRDTFDVAPAQLPVPAAKSGTKAETRATPITYLKGLN
jgi:hypothetical protein